MTTKLEDVLQYIETRAATIADLSSPGKIKVVHPGEPVPNFKDYGLRAYFGLDDWKENKRIKIGPILTEIYRVNVDLIFNKHLTSRTIFSDSKGLSYWENILTSTFANQRNNGLFKDSFWQPLGIMEVNVDSIIIKGVLQVTLENKLS